MKVKKDVNKKKMMHDDEKVMVSMALAGFNSPCTLWLLGESAGHCSAAVNTYNSVSPKIYATRHDKRDIPLLLL